MAGRKCKNINSSCLNSTSLSVTALLSPFFSSSSCLPPISWSLCFASSHQNPFHFLTSLLVALLSASSVPSFFLSVPITLFKTVQFLKLFLFSIIPLNYHFPPLSSPFPIPSSSHPFKPHLFFSCVLAVVARF